MGRIWLVAVLLLMWVCGAHTAEACNCASRSASCGPPGDFWRASAVFTGRVLAVERVSPRSSERRVRVRLLQRFRGALAAPGGEVLIFTAAVCRYPFKAGQEYFIYAVRQDDGRMTTTICSGTRPLERAASDLTYARGTASGDVTPGRIVGEVRHAAEHDSHRKPIPDVAVAVTRQGTTNTTVTDARGRFTLEPPAGGTYVLDLALPESLYMLQPGQTIELPDPRACVETNVDVLFDGHVYGRVVDSTGKGVAGLTVAHVRSGRAPGARLEHRRTLTRDDGTYQIEKLPPGPFVLALELPVGDLEHEQADAGETPALTRRGMLGGGERLTLGPLSLPSSVRIARLGGTVHTADGAPAPGARVFLKTGFEDGHILGEPAVADSLGRFLIAVLEGEQYQVFAERRVFETQAFRSEFSVPVMLSATREMPPLRLTVRRRF